MRSLSLLLTIASGLSAVPVRPHAGNPRYYEFRGKPVILLTSGEHYGAVLNGEFNFIKYLDTLRADGLNLTRVFSGVYRETPGDFGIPHNTLAPRPAHFVSPYARVTAPAARDGIGRFDLRKWNPAYWQRLKQFIAAASERGIVVEFTLFCVYYQDRMWELAPWHPDNNVNGLPAIPRGEVLTLRHTPYVRLQEEFVRKVASELRDADNVIFEICNEPYVTAVPEDWQRHMAKLLYEAESGFPARHMIGQNVANGSKKIEQADPHVSLFNFHYARPPVTVAQNYGLNRVIGLDETGFDGTLDAIYRIQAWDFLLAGGGHYNNLDYSFAVEHEDGSLPVAGTAPGGGSATLRKQLKILREFMEGLPFVSMAPAPSLVTGGLPEGFSARAFGAEGRVYAVYVHGGRALPNVRPRYVYRTDRQEFAVALNLPAGVWEAEWWDPRDGRRSEPSRFDHAGGHAWVALPAFTEDIAFVLRRKQ